MMKTLIVVLASLALVGLGVRMIYDATLSEEDRIRLLFAAEVEAFNTASSFSVMDGFALDYRDTTAGLTRSQLRGAVLYVFQKMRTPEGDVPYRVALPEDDLEVEIGEEVHRARVTGSLSLYETKAAQETLLWELGLDAQLQRGDGGWKIVKSSHETKRGRRPR